MASKRRYPPINCKNPDCRKEFIPDHKRKEYCNNQCRSDTNNDKKGKINREATYQKKLKQSDDALAYLFNEAGGDQYFIKESELQLIKVDLTIGEELEYPLNGDIIRWYINYGISDDGYMDDLHYYIISNKERRLYKF